MECHDVQQLLAFVQRRCEGLDAAERDAIREHLDRCPDCSARAQAEQRADETLGVLMRDVAVPAGLKQQVLNRLAAARRVARWQALKRGTLAATAAALLFAVVGAWIWYERLPAEVTLADANAVAVAAERTRNWDRDAAKDYLKLQGLADPLPPGFDFATLQDVKIVPFKGRRVAQLTFASGDNRATVLILPGEYFRIHDDLGDDLTSRKIETEGGIIYLILFQGNLDMLRPPPRLS